MAVVLPECLCPRDSQLTALAKVANNLSALFFLMSEGSFRGQTVNFGSCMCSEPQILAAMNANLVGFFNWVVENGIGSDVQAGVEDLATNDTSKAITFPTPFDSAPAVVPVLIAPDNSGFVISAVPDESTRTALGVTILFAAPIPASGYRLAWIAKEED